MTYIQWLLEIVIFIQFASFSGESILISSISAWLGSKVGQGSVADLAMTD